VQPGALGSTALPGRRPLKWQPLRYSRQRRAWNSLRSDSQALNFPAAAPLLGQRPEGSTALPNARGRDAVSNREEKLFVLHRDTVATAAAGAAGPPLSRRPRNRAPAAQLRARVSERSEFGPAAGASTAVVGTLVPEDVGGTATPAAAARRSQHARIRPLPSQSLPPPSRSRLPCRPSAQPAPSPATDRV